MKRLIYALLVFLTYEVNSQTYTWTNGGNDNDFENSANWSPTPVFGFPSSGETAIFDGNVSNANCNMPNDNDIGTIQMINGYGGVVDASGIQLTLGQIAINSGTFSSPSSTLHISGTNLLKGASGTFLHNSGTVEMILGSTTARSVNGALVLNNLNLVSSLSGNRTVNFVNNPTVAVINIGTGSNPFALRGLVNLTSQLVLQGTSSTAATSNTGTVLFAGTGNKTISGTGTALQNPIGNFLFNTTGTVSMSGNIAISSSWSTAAIGGLTAGSSTVSAVGSPTFYGGTTASTRSNFDNISIPATSTMIISGSSQLNVTGNIVNNGLITSNTSLIRFTGSGAQSLSGTSTTTLNAIDVSNTGTKSLNSALLILDSVGVSAAGTLSSGGNLTLRSVAAQKARIGRIAAGGDVSGNVIVQNYFPGGTTGWANLCSPGLSGQTMANWNTAFAITCSGCPTQSVGGQAFESIYSYNETLGAGQASASAHYVPISSLADPISPDKGYWVYLGDSYPGTGDITAVMTGNVNKNNSFGGYNLTLTGGVSSENGWNLISNPYPSPISLSRMFNGNTSNIDNSIQVWNADLNGGNGDWATYSLGGATDIIPMGQAFMVRVLGNAPLSISGSESWKMTSNASVQRMASNLWDIKNLFKLNLTGGGQGFDTYAYFDFSNQYSMGFDNGRDIYSIDNASGNTVAQIFSKVNGDKYMAGAFPMMPQNSYSVIPIHIPTGYSAPYTITGMNLQPGLCYELIDLSNNNVQDLYLGAYTTTIAANDGSNARFNLKVSDCGAAAPVAIKENQNNNGQVYITRNSNGVAVNFNFDQVTNSTISVSNVLGQKLSDDIKVNSSKETIYLNVAEKNQVIFVTVTTEGGNRVTKKLVY